MKKLLIGAVVILMAAAVGCTSGIENNQQDVSNPAEYRTISPAEAKGRLDSGEAATLLDVRTQEEYDEGHIAGSTLIPLDTLADKAESQLSDKDAVIFVYCRSGRRSKIAAEQLIDRGYIQVYDLGGILDWPYDITKE